MLEIDRGENVLYEVKIKVDADDIYKRLTPSERERFGEVIITDVDRISNEIFITAIAIEKKDYDEKKYYKLLNREFYLKDAYHLYSAETPLRRLD